MKNNNNKMLAINRNSQPEAALSIAASIRSNF